MRIHHAECVNPWLNDSTEKASDEGMLNMRRSVEQSKATQGASTQGFVPYVKVVALSSNQRNVIAVAFKK